MNSTYDISWFKLIIGVSSMIIPLLLFLYYKTNLFKSSLIATIRMVFQLLFVGIYLEYLFVLNSAIINSLWVLIMIFITSYTVADSTKLKFKYFAIPNALGIGISLILVDAFFLGYIIKLPNVFDAQYLIPITGMILGNALQNNIISINSFYNDIKTNEQFYRYQIACGANKKESTGLYMRDAIVKSFNPTIARMAVLGLISLPGTMTGQIIGGSSPMLAIKYQIMLMVVIFISSVLSTILAIVFANRIAFDEFSNLRMEIFK